MALSTSAHNHQPGRQSGRQAGHQSSANGVVEADAASTSRLCDERVEQLIAQIQPEAYSEERRRNIVAYVKSIIERCFASQTVVAFMFGSVPLKTYLPDGDIDLSLFQLAGPPLRDVWTGKLAAALEAEQVSPRAPYRVRDVVIINAEVSLVKCLVDNVVVDVSFETVGGLCTVLFLEAVDRLVQAQHLFKRSVILVKAWCYYESRLLGAHHGLISTYALEVLVLYVFNFYRDSCNTPLQVLSKFLQVFATFDWEHKCVTLQGPVLNSGFPNPKVDFGDSPPPSRLLDEDALATLLQRYRPNAPPTSRSFQLKFLNIVDPLLSTNNLGRSVSKASYARIRKAFAHGAATLSGLLTKSRIEAVAGLDHFFRNTWGAVTLRLQQQQQRRESLDAPHLRSSWAPVAPRGGSPLPRGSSTPSSMPDMTMHAQLSQLAQLQQLLVVQQMAQNGGTMYGSPEMAGVQQQHQQALQLQALALLQQQQRKVAGGGVAGGAPGPSAAMLCNGVVPPSGSAPAPPVAQPVPPPPPRQRDYPETSGIATPPAAMPPPPRQGNSDDGSPSPAPATTPSPLLRPPPAAAPAHAQWPEVGGRQGRDRRGPVSPSSSKAEAVEEGGRNEGNGACADSIGRLPPASPRPQHNSAATGSTHASSLTGPAGAPKAYGGGGGEDPGGAVPAPPAPPPRLLVGTPPPLPAIATALPPGCRQSQSGPAAVQCTPSSTHSAPGLELSGGGGATAIAGTHGLEHARSQPPHFRRHSHSSLHDLLSESSVATGSGQRRDMLGHGSGMLTPEMAQAAQLSYFNQGMHAALYQAAAAAAAAVVSGDMAGAAGIGMPPYSLPIGWPAAMPGPPQPPVPDALQNRPPDPPWRQPPRHVDVLSGDVQGLTEQLRVARIAQSQRGAVAVTEAQRGGLLPHSYVAYGAGGLGGGSAGGAPDAPPAHGGRQRGGAAMAPGPRARQPSPDLPMRLRPRGGSWHGAEGRGYSLPSSPMAGPHGGGSVGRPFHDRRSLDNVRGRGGRPPPRTVSATHLHHLPGGGGGDAALPELEQLRSVPGGSGVVERAPGQSCGAPVPPRAPIGVPGDVGLGVTGGGGGSTAGSSPKACGGGGPRGASPVPPDCTHADSAEAAVELFPPERRATPPLGRAVVSSRGSSPQPGPHGTLPPMLGVGSGKRPESSHGRGPARSSKSERVNGSGDTHVHRPSSRGGVGSDSGSVNGREASAGSRAGSTAGSVSGAAAEQPQQPQFSGALEPSPPMFSLADEDFPSLGGKPKPAIAAPPAPAGEWRRRAVADIAAVPAREPAQVVNGWAAVARATAASNAAEVATNCATHD